jgi:hypothetical protein
MHEIPQTEILKFYISASTYAFEPVFGVTSGVLHWDLADGSIVDENSFSHTYSMLGNKRVKIYQGTTDGTLGITSIEMAYREDGDIEIYSDLAGALDIHSLENLGYLDLYGNLNLTQIINPVSSNSYNLYHASLCNLTGTLDISGLTGLGGSFRVDGNPNLTQILNPNTSQLFTEYYANECNLTGTLDISCLPHLGGYFSAYNNPNLTQIINPNSSEVFTGYMINGCNLIGALDISCLTGLGGEFSASTNPNLTKIINPNSSEIFLSYFVENDNLTGTLDISCLTGLGGYFSVYNNPNLTQIINPDTSQFFYSYYVPDCNLTGTLDLSSLIGSIETFYSSNNINLLNIILPPTPNFWVFNANNCSLNISTVDYIFDELDAWFQANPPTRPLTVDLGGGGNSWPTDGWSNTNLVALQDLFSNFTQDISITINTPPLENAILQFTTNASTNAFDPAFNLS